MFGNAAASAGRSTEGKRAENKSRDRHHRAGIARAHERFGFAVAHQPRGHVQRAILLPAEGLRRGIVIVITSVALTISIGRSAVLWRLSSCANRRFDADKEHANAQLARRQNRAFDFGARRVVASHRIKSNRDHLCSADTDSGMVRRGKLRPSWPWCQSLRGHCSSRTAGTPGGAASFRGNSGIRRGTVGSR